jgi:hypothetical protein
MEATLAADRYRVPKIEPKKAIQACPEKGCRQ